MNPPSAYIKSVVPYRLATPAFEYKVVYICLLTGRTSGFIPLSPQASPVYKCLAQNPNRHIHCTTRQNREERTRTARGRESGSRNHIIRLSVENFNLLNYLSIYTCRHSSSVIALISEDLLGKFIDLHHLRMALSVTPNFLPI